MGDPGITPWLVIALRVISNPCSNALQKALASNGWPAPVLLAFTHGTLGPVAMVLLLRAGDSLGWVFWSWSLLSAALAVAANWLIIEAVRRSDLSLLGPINAYKPWVSTPSAGSGWAWFWCFWAASYWVEREVRSAVQGRCSWIEGFNFASWLWCFRPPRR
jgi:hypothetical protein